jgi:predicted GIY-YIG superfamily endonuclease
MLNIIKMLTIYALKLESNKYYVGQTHRATGANIRFQEHKSGNGSEWTKLYKPISILETYETESLFEEDILTKKYMIKYGIENVRGGSYTKIDLDEWQIKSLEHEFKSVSDSCYNCGKKGHFAKDCDKYETINKYLSQFTSEDELEREISKMEKLRIHFTQENDTIQRYKYILYYEQQGEGKNRKNIDIKIEIEPSIINKYDYSNFIYEEANYYNRRYNSDDKKTVGGDIYHTQILNIIREIHGGLVINPNNVIENIYKIYVSRVKRERDFKKLIHENGLDEIDCLKEINKRIEILYKKYAEFLS